MATNTLARRQAFGIGHRGARLITKENTLDSFRKCVELGINMIEFDINRTADGTLVIYHDNKMADDRLISEMTFEEFQAYDADFPSLASFLTDPVIVQSDVKFYFDIKDRLVPAMLMTYLKELVVDNPSFASRCWIASFIPADVATAIAMRASEPSLAEVLIGGLFEDSEGHYLLDDTANVYSSMGYNFISVKYLLATKELIHDCHEKGVAVFAWVTNTEEECENMFGANIDGYCSDDMDLLVKYQLKSAAAALANNVVNTTISGLNGGIC